MLDTNICSFIMRERPPAVVDRLQRAIELQNSVAISVITYYEMLLGAIGKTLHRSRDLIEAFGAPVRHSAWIAWPQRRPRALEGI